MLTITPWLESNKTIAFPFTQDIDGEPLERLVVDAYISYRSPRNSGKLKLKYLNIYSYPGSGLDPRVLLPEPNNILDETAQYEGILNPDMPLVIGSGSDNLNEGWIVKAVIEFEDHEILFDSDLAATFKALTYSSTFVILEWTFNRLTPMGFEGFDVVKLVIDSQELAAITFPLEPDNAFFVEQVVQCDPVQINSITLDDAVIKGKVVISAGYNMDMEVTDNVLELPLILDTPTDQVFDRNKKILNISAVAGAGAGQYLNCEEPDAFIKTINTIPPSDNGNFILNATECYWPEVLGSNLGLEFLLSQTPTVKLRNVCSPCCTCDQYYDSYEAMRYLWDRLKIAAQKLQEAKELYEGMVELYKQVCPSSDPNYTSSGSGSGSGGSGSGGTGGSSGSGTVVLDGPPGSARHPNDQFSVHVFLMDQLAWTGWIELCFYNRGTTTQAGPRDYQLKILPFDFSTKQAGDPGKLLIPGNNAKRYYNGLVAGQNINIIDSESFQEDTVCFHNGVLRWRSTLIMAPGNFEFLTFPIYLEDFNRPETGKSWREDYIADNFIYGIKTKLELWTPQGPKMFVHNGDNQTILRPPFTRT